MIEFLNSSISFMMITFYDKKITKLTNSNPQMIQPCIRQC